MLSFFDCLWSLSFACIQSIFNYDFFLGQTFAYCVIIFSTLFMFAFVFIGFFHKRRA